MLTQRTEWTRWFAWYPVVIDGQWAWLRWIERRKTTYWPL